MPRTSPELLSVTRLGKSSMLDEKVMTAPPDPVALRDEDGAVLLALAEQAARAFGRIEVVINAHPTSLTFYLANGYREGAWRDKGPVPAALIRVGKRLELRTGALTPR